MADEVAIPPAEIRFDRSVFSVEAVKKAAYRFSDRAIADIRVDDREIVCRLEFRSQVNPPAFDSLLSEFRTEVLDNDLRASIALETAPIRNAILAYAFSRTGLQDKE